MCCTGQPTEESQRHAPSGGIDLLPLGRQPRHQAQLTVTRDQRFVDLAIDRIGQQFIAGMGVKRLEVALCCPAKGLGLRRAAGQCEYKSPESRELLWVQVVHGVARSKRMLKLNIQSMISPWPFRSSACGSFFGMAGG